MAILGGYKRESAYAGFSGKLKTGALRAAFNKKFPNG
jgi:hypothetical protein